MTTLLLLGLTAGSLVSAAQETRPANTPATQAVGEFKPGALLVKFSGELSASLAQSVMDQYGATYVRTLYGSAVQVWQVAEGQELALAAQLTADPLIEYAEPDHIYHILEMPQDTAVTPNDSGYPNQWAHPKINSPAAWDVTTGSTSVTIAIIDTGIDEGHPDLASKVVAGYDFVSDDSNPHDGNGHGTHVAGIATAITNNTIGVAGVDWNARIMPIRVLNDAGSGYSSDITEGINWAYQHGAKVLNLSLGGPGYSQSMQDAVTAAHTAGSLVVAAMGNDNTSTPSYPAAYYNVLAVAATGPTDGKASYSNYGSHCDIAAPGGDMGWYHDPAGIYSTMPTYDVYLTTHYSYYKNYDYLNGTSQASPYVAGLAALIFGLDTSLTPDEVQQIIEDTAVDLGATGWDVYYGWGRINAAAAVKPSVPTLDNITNDDLNGNYTVDWTDVSGATYTLQEDDNSSFTSPNEYNAGTTSQYSVSGQTIGMWYYRVRATRASVDSDWSNTQSVSVAPSAPTLIAIGNGDLDGNYTVDWTDVSGATYTLQEDSNSSFISPNEYNTGTTSQHSVSGQDAGAWYYRVRATEGGMNSNWSTTQSVGVAPSAPTLNAISNPTNTDEYLVDWGSVTGATGYTLQEDNNASFTSPEIRYMGAATQYNVTGQREGTWYYRVSAYNSVGSGPWSGNPSTTVNPLPLDEPTLLPPDNADGDDSYLVAWSVVPSATAYTLEESNNPYFDDPNPVYSGDLLQYNVTGQSGGTWYYRVRAFVATSGIHGPWSVAASVIVPAKIYLPLVLIASASGPTPGFWESATGDEFYVTTDRAYVDNFAVFIYVPGCGYYKITHIIPEPITSNQFSFSGSFYASGTFDSSTTASGTDGLISFYIPGCGTVSGGPWSWSATWQDNSQPTFLPVQVVEPNNVTPVFDAEGQYRVVVIER